MVRRLELVGILLIAAGLVTLAAEDPIVRILIFGIPATAGAAARAQFASSNATTGSFTTFRAATTGGGVTEIVATFAAFGACVIGLVLVVTGALTEPRVKSEAVAEAKEGS